MDIDQKSFTCSSIHICSIYKINSCLQSSLYSIRSISRLYASMNLIRKIRTEERTFKDMKDPSKKSQDHALRSGARASKKRGRRCRFEPAPGRIHSLQVVSFECLDFTQFSAKATFPKQQNSQTCSNLLQFLRQIFLFLKRPPLLPLDRVSSLFVGITDTIRNTIIQIILKSFPSDPGKTDIAELQIREIERVVELFNGFYLKNGPWNFLRKRFQVIRIS